MPERIETYQQYMVPSEPGYAPKRPEPGLLYIEEWEPGRAWAAVLQCPCGCGDRLGLNLCGELDTPSWQLSGSVKQPTISPSILRTIGCRSHFFIRGGQVVWT